MINITITKSLETVLKNSNIPIEEYTPAYNGESAGLDLYNVGESVPIRPMTSSYTVLGDNNNASGYQIPTGVKISVPKGYVALIKERGSISKTPLKIRAGVIDSGYSGEVFVNCLNAGRHVHTIYRGSKLPFQIVVVKCDNEFNVIDNESFNKLTAESHRKTGKIGSSDS
jgi:dUTP pyrophosphatase